MDVSAESPLLRSDTDGVVRLTLNRPQAYNSLSYALLGRSRTSSPGSPWTPPRGWW